MAVHTPALHNDLIPVLKEPDPAFCQTGQFVLGQVTFQQASYTHILPVGVYALAVVRISL